MAWRRTTTLLLASLLLLSAAVSVSQSAQQAPPFRAGIDLVNLTATVADRKGELITQLTADDFEVYEDGKKQTVRYFAPGSDSAGPELHVGVLLDVSESMLEDISFTRSAAIRFLNTLTDAIDMTVVDFDTEVRVARYAQRDFARVVERIRQQKVSGSTAMYDAIGVYLDGAAAQDGRKVMLLYTDGADTRSTLKLTDLLTLLKSSDVTVFVVGALGHQSSFTRNERRLVMQQIAEASGGLAVFTNDVKQLDKVYQQIAAEIRAQYTLGYVSTNDKRDGSWRRVEVRARQNGTDAKVRARRGYFAPYGEIGSTRR